MLVSCKDSRVAYPCWYMLKQQLLAFEKATTNCKVTKVGKGVSAPIQHGYTDSLSRVDSDLPFFQTSGVQEAFERFDLQQVGFLPETFDIIWPLHLSCIPIQSRKGADCRWFFQFRGFLGPIEICQALRHLGFHTSPDEILDWLEVRALGDGSWMG